MTAPLITAITTVPNRENATNQASFSNDVDTFFSEVDDFQTQANTQAQYLDGVAAQVDASEAAAAASALESAGYASTALDARDAAIASAEYKGTWEGKTSAGVIGQSYSYKGSYIYRLNVNLANLSTSEPSPTNTNWQLINVVPFEAPCKPTLDLDFANQDFTIYDKQGGFVKRPLADIVSQGRATAGTSTDAIGGVTEFAAGENRFTFDGESGEALGYLSEESRTNLLRYSEDFSNAVWDKAGVPSFSNSGTGIPPTLEYNQPSLDGNNSAVKVTLELSSGFSDSGNRSGFYQNLTGLDTTKQHLSISRVKPIGATTIEQLVNSSVGSLAAGGAPVSSIKKLSNGWYLIVRALTPSTASGTFRFQLIGGPANIGKLEFLLDQSKLEVGQFPTSYIRTLNAPVTRATDAMTRTLGQEWNPNEGTFVVELSSDIEGFYPRVFEIGTSTANRIIIRKEEGASKSSPFTLVSSNTSAHAQLPSTTRVFAISVNRQGSAVFVSLSTENGFVGAYTANVSVISNVLSIGSTLTGLPTGQANGTIKRLQYYPRAFDPLTLQRLSRIQ